MVRRGDADDDLTEVGASAKRPSMRRMPEKPPGEGKLTRPTPGEERDALRLWRLADDGMNGPRSSVVPQRPDDMVAYRLLEAADSAMVRGDWQRGVNILRLVVRDYRQSQEAAVARSVIDNLLHRGR